MTTHKGRYSALLRLIFSSFLSFSLLFCFVAISAWAADALTAEKEAPSGIFGNNNPDDILAYVGDSKITRGDLMKEIENFQQNGSERAIDINQKDILKKFLSELIDIKLLEKKAEQENILQKPELEDQIHQASVAFLANAFIQKNLGNSKITRNDIEKYYQANKTRFATPATYHLHQITVDSKAAADEIKQALEGKKSFAELAKEKSIDGFKSSGGDRGFLALSEMQPFVAAAITQLSTDQISAPIAAENGKFMLVKYSEKKEGRQKPLEEVAGEIERELKDEQPRKALEEKMAELEKEFSVKFEPTAIEILRKGEFKPSDLDQVLFTIGTEAIKIQALMPELDRIPPFIRPAILGGEGLNDFVKQFMQRELIRRYVEKNFEAMANEFPNVIKDAKRRIALKVLLDEKIGNVVTVSDDEIKDFYTKNLAEFAQPEQIRAHHILVESEEKAKELLSRLAKNEKFEDLAKAESKCPSGKEGGDLGYFTKGQMVPEFDQAVQKAEIGKIVGPVKTKFGFHIIRVDERIPASTKPLDEVKDQIRSQMLAQKQKAAFEKLLEDLRKEFPVKETNLL